MGGVGRLKSCAFCGDEFPDARPYLHCTKRECVDTWKIGRRNAMTLVRIPKSGWIPAYKDDQIATTAPTR